VDCPPLVLAPDEKNASSDTEAADSERTGRARDKDPVLDPERDWKSDISGMVSIGGRNVVEREPETAELELVLALAIDRIVRIEPVGDCVSDQSDTVTERSRTSLNTS
jgi:hypothetical protein